MAAFGISFPKLTLCRSSTSKADTNIVSTTTTSTPNTTARTVSLSIKNIPSQPLHYDVSTTAVKKKTTSSIATILAIDGETKQLPKNLSVFNELQLDEKADNIDEKRKREKNSSDAVLSSSLSPMGTVDHRSDIRFLADIDSKKIQHDPHTEEKHVVHERRSNHTFTPPTASLSNTSSSSLNDVHLTVSSLSVDLPRLKYAIEQFLVDDDDAVGDPIYEVAEEFSSSCFLSHQDANEIGHSSNLTSSIVKHDQTENTKDHSMYDKNVDNEIPSDPSHISNSMKWYVSELRINRPLIYRTQWTDGQQNSGNRKLSHSVNDLIQIYNVKKYPHQGKYKIISRRPNNIAYSTLSLQNFHNQQEQQTHHHQSDDKLPLHNYLSCTDDELSNFQSDEDSQRLSLLRARQTLHRALSKDDTLIRNESVKKKLFDILNDDELENACLEDMSQEFEKLTITHRQRALPIVNSFSSSSDDALYSSPPNELHLPLSLSPPPLSASYTENLSTNTNHTTECYLGRSRLITTSLDKIPSDNNTHNHLVVSRSSHEHTRPSWYTSPSPQWRMDVQVPSVSIFENHSSKHINLDQLVTEYDVKENKSLQKYNHHRKEHKHVSYSLVNTSTPLVDDSTPMLPIIQDKSPNLLMFI